MHKQPIPEPEDYPELPDFLVIHDVADVNSRLDPEVKHQARRGKDYDHPFVVGSKHIEHASKYHSNRLGEATVNAVPCAECGLDYAAHISDRVMFFQLTRHATQQELTDWAQNVQLEAYFAEHSIDGLAFMETPENYRFSPSEGNDNG